MNLATREDALVLFHFNEVSGDLIWRERTPDMFRGASEQVAKAACLHWNQRYAGRIAGTVSHGYRVIVVGKRPFLAHRVVWLIHTGAWPKEQIDHKAGNRSDNRPSQIREASLAENRQNHCLRRDNSSGFPGVHWSEAAKKWQARLGSDGRRVYLGCFDNKGDAIAAVIAAKARLHPFQPFFRGAA